MIKIIKNKSEVSFEASVNTLLMQGYIMTHFEYTAKEEYLAVLELSLEDKPQSCIICSYEYWGGSECPECGFDKSNT